MHLVAFVEHPDHVCCRYRLRAFEPVFNSLGFTVQFQTRPHGFWQAMRRNLPPADGCIIQRWLPSLWELRRLRQRYRFLAFDFDDAVWLRDSYSPKGLHSARRLRRFASVVRTSDLVVAGNAFLAEQANRLAPTRRVIVIPTCISPADYPVANHDAEQESVRLVWIGSSSTLKGLVQMTPLLERATDAVPGLRLKLICDRFPQFGRMPVECCEWRQNTEAAELASADIGIAWMPDDDWSRGKCGLKVLQYMAAGLPVVANRVGVHGEMVRHGESGLLANRDAEWIEAFRGLARDFQMRQAMGLAGRRQVERDYSVQFGEQRWRLALGESICAPNAA